MAQNALPSAAPAPGSAALGGGPHLEDLGHGVASERDTCLVCGKAFPSRSQLFKHLERECSLRCGSRDGVAVARPNDNGMVQAASTQGGDIKERPKSRGKSSRVISDAAVTLVAPCVNPTDTHTHSLGADTTPTVVAGYRARCAHGQGKGVKSVTMTECAPQSIVGVHGSKV
jgi:hypothetical protein